MRQKAALVGIVLFALASPSALAASKITPGAACTSHGKVVLQSGKKYTCVQVGKKWLWNKGVAIAQPKPAPAPAIPSTTATPSATPTASVTPTVVPPAPTTSATPTATPTVIVPTPIATTTEAPTPPATPPVVSPTPSPTLAPDPMPSPAPVPSPTPTFTEPARPASVADLSTHPESIAYWAWKLSKADIESSSAVAPPPMKFLIGPNTTKTTESSIRGITLAAQLFAGRHQPRSVTAIMFSIADRDWAQHQINAVSPMAMGREAEFNCQTATTCWGGQAITNLQGDAYLILAVPAADRQDANHTSGSLEAHEFTHTVQSMQFMDAGKLSSAWNGTKGWVPSYLVEGQAEWAQIAAVYSSTFAAYSAERRGTAGELPTLKLTQAWLENFLNPAPDPVSHQQMWAENWRLYDIGMLFTECLVAVQGPQAPMQLFEDVAGGKSFASAFAARFGIEWPDAVPYLAKAIDGLIRTL